MAQASGTQPLLPRLNLESVRHGTENREDLAAPDTNSTHPGAKSYGSHQPSATGQPRLGTPRSPPRSHRDDTAKVSVSGSGMLSSTPVPSATPRSARSTPRTPIFISPRRPTGTPRSARSAFSGSAHSSCGNSSSQSHRRRGKVQHILEPTPAFTQTPVIEEITPCESSGSERTPTKIADVRASSKRLLEEEFVDISVPDMNDSGGNHTHVGNSLHHDETFTVEVGWYLRCVFATAGLLSLSGAAASIVFSILLYTHSSRSLFLGIVLCLLALCLALMAIPFFLRLCVPTSLRITRVDGTWVIILQRRGMSPATRSLVDLEAFVETFAYSSRLQGFWEKSAGFVTSRTGSVHLFFSESASRPALLMTASLATPLPFFTKLRNVMIELEHPLAQIAIDYVEDWDTGASTNRMSVESSVLSDADLEVPEEIEEVEGVMQ